MEKKMKMVVFGFMVSLGWYAGKGIFLAVGEKIEDVRFKRKIQKRYKK